MGNFIQRDYNIAKVLAYTRKIAIKNRYRRLNYEYDYNGVNLLLNRVYYREGNMVGNPKAPYFTEYTEGIRSDNAFKLFLKYLGTNRKYLRKQKYTGTDAVWFTMNNDKLLVTEMNDEEFSDNFDTRYGTPSRFKESSDNVIWHHPVNTPTYIGTLVSNPIVPPELLSIGQTANFTRYVFYYDGAEHTISQDGRYELSTYGLVSITQKGIDDGYGKVSYTEFNSYSDDLTAPTVTPPVTFPSTYDVRTVYTRNDSVEIYDTVPITIGANREYIDVVVTIGGDYQLGTFPTKDSVNARYSAATFLDTDGTELSIANNLDLNKIRTIVENDPAKYLGGIYDGVVTTGSRGRIISIDDRLVNIKIGGLNSAYGTASYDKNYGHMCDTLALFDTNHEVYEVVEDCINERLIFDPIVNAASEFEFYNVRADTSASSALNPVGQFRVKYTYTKRYKLVAPSNNTAFITKANSYLTKVVNALDTASGGLTEILHMQQFANNMYTGVINSDIKNALYYIGLPTLYSDGLWYVKNGNMTNRLNAAAYDALTPNEFITVFAKTISVDYSLEDKEHHWYDIIVAIIIVIVGILVTIFATAWSYLYWGTVGAALFAAAVVWGLYFYLASTFYASAIGNESGMKFIGGVAQVGTIMLSLASIYTAIEAAFQAWSSYSASAGAMSSADLAMAGFTQAEFNATLQPLLIAALESTAQAVMVTYGTLTGIAGAGGDSELGQIIAIAAAAYGAYQAGVNMQASLATVADDYQNSGLLATTFKNTTNLVKLSENLLKGYIGVTSYGTTNHEQMVTAEQPQKSNGVSQAYVLTSMTLKNDALESLYEKHIRGVNGLNMTDMLKNRQYFGV